MNDDYQINEQRAQDSGCLMLCYGRLFKDIL